MQNDQVNPFAVSSLSDSVEARGDQWNRPSRARWLVLFLMCSMAFVLYLDRVCMSQAIKPIADEFGLSGTHKSLILMAFTLAYGLFEIPTGHWGDRYGSRRILTRIVVWWSIFTALTAGCVGFYSLILVRFLFGAGEAGAFPNAARVFATWFPIRERGRVQGAFLAASLLGGALSPFVAAVLIEIMGWRLPFLVFGAAGWVWALLFFWWFRDDPARHSAVNKVELQLIQSDPAPKHVDDSGLPWRRVFRHRTIWLLGFIVTCGAFNSYLYFSWYSNYLQSARGAGNLDAGWLSGMVLASGALGQLVGGASSSWLVRRSGLGVRARRYIGCACYASAATALLISMQFDSIKWSAAFAALSCTLMFFQQSIWWSCTTDVSGRHVGALFGLANGLGVFGAMGSQFFFGAFTDWRQSQGYVGRPMWDPAMYVVAAVLVCGAIAWLFVDPTTTVEGETVASESSTRGKPTV